VINPLAVIPVFLSMTGDYTKQQRVSQARKASIYMASILAFFLFAGSFILDFFGIGLDSIRVAGGIVITRSGFLLLTTARKPDISKSTRKEGILREDISLSPLALPLLSGPGAIAATLSYATQNQNEIAATAVIFLAILTSGLISFVVLGVSGRVIPILGKAGLEATTRIMGFIAMTVGVQFIMNGLLPYLIHVIKESRIIG
jgi:multiple antibiotic resistance protein